MTRRRSRAIAQRRLEIVRKASVGIDVVDDGDSAGRFLQLAKYRLEGVESRPVPAKPDDKVSANKFLHPAMKSVMSSLARGSSLSSRIPA
jgi:hypothetical protein